MELKKRLGLIPDFQGEKESTANTSLEYHAGRCEDETRKPRAHSLCNVEHADF